MQCNRERSYGVAESSRRGRRARVRSWAVVLGLACLAAWAQVGFAESVAVAGKTGSADLVICDQGKSEAVVVVSPSAGEWEKKAAADLRRYVEMMSGATVGLADTAETIPTALAGKKPLLIVGQEALKADASLKERLAKAAKPNPVLRADAIVLKRDGNRVLLAGSNDESHYYAAAELLRRWGCRWYMQTDFGECIPAHARLTVGELDYAYGTPFEIRKYWLSWIGDTTGQAEFMHRNMMNTEAVPSGHCLAQYTKDIAPGGDVFKVPVSEPATAQHVARQLAAAYAKGGRIMLGMEDGRYSSDSPRDKELMNLQYDKYMMTPSMTDAFMAFYNGVADILMKQYPTSQAKIGFLAYSNMTLPPVRPTLAKKPLVAYLAPIDIDPIHGMDDPKSPPRQEYREIMYKWAKVMEGRLAIYDYDQGMLVWRDIPNPSIECIRQDVKHYREAGILGVDTESRGAVATTFINLYIRARLYWNPNEDVDALIAEFYPAFYGPAAEPMAAYWNAIFKAWKDSICTEHEYFVAPAIYTPELIDTLRKQLALAEEKVKPLAAKSNPTRNEKLLLERMRFTRLGFGIIENYLAMVRAAASEVDYRAGLAAGEKGLATREELTAMNGIFTTYKKIGESGSAWWPGEVQQYRELLEYTEGKKGALLAKLPLEWAFRRDPGDAGVKEGWAGKKADLTYWNEKGKQYTLETRKDYPADKWEVLRTDLYIQAQGVRSPDSQSYTGHGWYQTVADLKGEQAGGSVHLMFPGLFNECWLYLNGAEVAHRDWKNPLWWLNDYRFEWDVDLTGKLKAGENVIALRIHNPHHFGGMFRRPFLYRAK